MARRSDHSREQLYDLALEAAGRIVAEEGGAGLTARKVADAIGYSVGTLYNLFTNLDDLILHLNGRTLDALAGQLGEVALCGEPEADVTALLDRYLAFEAANRAAWGLLFEHRLPSGRDLPDWYRQKITAALAIVEAALAPLPLQEGKARAAQTLWACLHGIVSLGKSGKLQAVADDSAEQLAHHFVATYLAGLRSRA